MNKSLKGENLFSKYKFFKIILTKILKTAKKQFNQNFIKKQTEKPFY